MFSVPLDEVQQFFAVLVALYAMECAWWLRGAACRFFPGAFAGWSDRPTDGPGVDAWRLSLSNPLPFMTGYTGEICPFAFDGDVLLVPTIDGTSGREHCRPVSFSSIAGISSADASVLIDGVVAASCSTASHASLLASRLERIRTATPDSRESVADRVIADMHDVVAAQERFDSWRAASAVSRACGGTLALVSLVGGPLVWAGRATVPPHLPTLVLALAVLLWVATAVAGLLIPGTFLAGGKPAGVHRTIAFLSPATAMRLYDTLGRDMLIGFAPLIVATVTTPRSRVSDVVTAHLRAAVHPLPPPADTEPAAVNGERVAEAHRWYHEHTAMHAKHALITAGMEPDVMLATVADADGAHSFCPRCARTFVQHEGRCHVCDFTLERLAK